MSVQLALAAFWNCVTQDHLRRVEINSSLHIFRIGRENIPDIIKNGIRMYDERIVAEFAQERLSAVLINLVHNPTSRQHHCVWFSVHVNSQYGSEKCNVHVYCGSRILKEWTRRVLRVGMTYLARFPHSTSSDNSNVKLHKNAIKGSITSRIYVSRITEIQEVKIRISSRTKLIAWYHVLFIFDNAIEFRCILFCKIQIYTI